MKKLRQEGYMKLVIGVTGNVLDDDVVEYISAGADLILSKPMKISSLRALLHHVQQHGPFSRPGMMLAEDSDCFISWTSKV